MKTRCGVHEKIKHMKMNCLRTEWLIVSLGILLVGGGTVGTVEYLALKRKVRSEEVHAAILDRLHQGQQLCSILKTLREGNISEATQRLDLKLCEDIRILNSRLDSTDDRTRIFVRGAFAHIARMRPKNTQDSAEASRVIRLDQIEAERILTTAYAENTRAPVPAAAP